MTRYATPRILADAGFVIGRSPDMTCNGCPHIWGEHHLVPFFEELPIMGGIAHCHESGCGCIGAWDTPVFPDTAKDL
jgi:hypothetical protein